MRSTRAVVLTGIAGVLAGVLIFFGIVSLAGSGKAKSKLASDVFKVGKAKNQAAIVDRHGPLLFADPLQRGRDIYLSHLGDDRWAAFDVHPSGEPKTCTVTWQAQTRSFHDPCSGRLYPTDGTGLTRYSAYVDKKGDLVVDLRRPLT
ncbi:MAG: hypothetical protein JWP02_2378 [Acidimicrobiales bacterium]|nr:hypothetical protein [Acidimicrobiales bacterium]